MLNLKISWIKYEKDDVNFIIPERLGMKVEKLENPEEVDNKMKELINQNYKTIILSNEIAGFSNDIIRKYQNNSEVNIVISTRKEQNYNN